MSYMSTYEKLEKENREYIVKKLGEFFGNTEDHIVEVLHDKIGNERKEFVLEDAQKQKTFSIHWVPQTVYTSEKCYSIEKALISVYPFKEASYTHVFNDILIVVNDAHKDVITNEGIKLSSQSKISEYSIGESSGRWNTLNTQNNMTLKEWHDTQKAAESVVKKLNTYNVGILKRKIADYSHFTIEEFHELASELLMIQCAEEEKQVEKEREEELGKSTRRRRLS